MDKIRNVLLRLRWERILAIIFLICAVGIILYLVVPNLISNGCEMYGDISVSSWADPKRINLNPDAGTGKVSTIWVDVKNMGENDLVVDIYATTPPTTPPSMEFMRENDGDANITNDGSRIEQLNITMRPDGDRKVGFRVRVLDNALKGTYIIDVSIRSGDETIKKQVRLTVN